MFNYQRFLQILDNIGKPINLNEGKDNFDWEYLMIEKIRQWYLNSKISCEDAFKIIDKDFDNFVG